MTKNCKFLFGNFPFLFSYRTSKYPIRVNKFSSPSVYVNRVLPTGVSGEADCRRAHLERRFVMAARGDESGVCQPKASDESCTLWKFCCSLSFVTSCESRIIHHN